MFAQLGLEYDLRLVMAGVLNVVQLVAIMVSLCVIDRVGRRPMLIGGAIGMVACHSIVAAIIGKFNSLVMTL